MAILFIYIYILYYKWDIGEYRNLNNLMYTSGNCSGAHEVYTDKFVRIMHAHSMLVPIHAHNLLFTQ